MPGIISKELRTEVLRLKAEKKMSDAAIASKLHIPEVIVRSILKNYKEEA